MKSLSRDRLTRAEHRSEQARRRLMVTADEIRHRLSPREVARKASEHLIETGSEMADAGIATARRHSGRIVGLAALLGLMLARHRIGRWLGRHKRDATGTPE